MPAFSRADMETPIQHVVYVMMENHSFDNIFGVYPTDNSNPPNIAQNLTVPINLLGDQTLLSELSAVPPGSFSTPNPHESVYPQDFDNGKMDGFAANSGPQSMTYFTQSQLA